MDQAGRRSLFRVNSTFLLGRLWTEKLRQETVGSGRAVERQAWYKGIEPFLARQFHRVVQHGTVGGGRHGIKGSPLLVPTKNSPEL